MGRITDAVKHLLIINVIFYAVTFLIPNMEDKMFEWFALFYPTSPFLNHGNLLHTCLCTVDSCTLFLICMHCGLLALH